MDIKHHSTFFFCKLLLTFINCFLPLNALPFGLNINLLGTESISVNSPASHLLLHRQTIFRLPPSQPARSTCPLLPRSSITPILHLISNPSFAPYCHYLLLPYYLSKLQFGPGGVIPPRPSTPPSPSYHYNLLQRKLRDPKSLQCILPRSSWEWLLSHFPSVSSSYPIVHDTFVSVPIILLSRLLTQYDNYSPLLIDPSLGLSSLLPSHTWHKCRHAAPKIARHTGIIRSTTGDVCKTTADLDRALRATRSFWQEYPCPYDPSWSSLLQDYAVSFYTVFSLSPSYI